MQRDSIRTKTSDTYGVRKASWQKLKGYRYYHDTMEGKVDLSLVFGDTVTDVTDTHVIRERRQESGGRIFVVNSIFDRFSSKTAADKLNSLVEIEAEKDVRNIG